MSCSPCKKITAEIRCRSLSYAGCGRQALYPDTLLAGRARPLPEARRPLVVRVRGSRLCHTISNTSYGREEVDVARLVQARLDEETMAILRDLKRRTNLSESEIVRRGIRTLAAVRADGGVRVIGVGRFASGHRDLGSNKAHLEGFGRSKA